MWPKVCGHPSSTLRIKVYESMFFMVWAVPLVLNLHDLAYKDISDKQCATDFVTQFGEDPLLLQQMPSCTKPGP